MAITFIEQTIKLEWKLNETIWKRIDVLKKIYVRQKITIQYFGNLFIKKTKT
jgi:hypothetical protein